MKYSLGWFNELKNYGPIYGNTGCDGGNCVL